MGLRKSTTLNLTGQTIQFGVFKLGFPVSPYENRKQFFKSEVICHQMSWVHKFIDLGPIISGVDDYR